MTEIEDLRERLERLEREVALLRGRPLDEPAPRQAKKAAATAEPAVSPGYLPKASPEGADIAPSQRVVEADRFGAYLARGGAIALLAGLAFAFKLAADRGWIGPGGRVLVGLAAGAGLIIYAERAHARGWAPLAAALTGGGAAICYLSLLASGQLYDLVPDGVMFAGLIAVTALVAFVANRRASEPLAILATVGAMINPLLLMSGDADPEAALVYLVAVNVALVQLARNRWNGVETVALAGTLFVFALASEEMAFGRAAVYATVLLALWTAVPLLRAERHPSDPGLSIAAGLAYVWFLVSGLGSNGAEAVAALTVAAGYALLSVASRGTRHAHLSIPWLGMAAACVAIASQAGLGRRDAAVAWSIQGALIFWFSFRQRLPLGARIGLAQLALGTLTGATRLAEYDPQRAFASADAVTFILHTVALGVAAFAASRLARGEDARLTPILAGAAQAFGLIWVSMEVWHLAGRGQPGGFAISALWVAYGATLVVAGVTRNIRGMRQAGLAVFAAVGAKLALYDLTALQGFARISAFMVAGAILVGCGIAYQRLRD